MLLFNPQCHTGPPLRYVPVIECKGTYNLGNMQIMKEKLACHPVLIAASFFRQMSKIFTNISGGLRLPFFRPFQALGLWAKETLAFDSPNSYFP